MSAATGRLEDRVAVITGAGGRCRRRRRLRGPRRARWPAERLAHGFEAAHSLPTHEQIIATGGRASFQRADVTSEADMHALGAHASGTFGRIDIWVNNAGIVKPAPIEEMPVPDFELELAVDLTGTWLGCKVATAAMRRQHRIGRSAGHIVNLGGSIAPSFGNANITAYAAAKGTMHTLARALATELGPDRINVNAVAPGFLPTAMNCGFWDDPVMLSAIQSAPPGIPEDVAEAIVFLASEESVWITGVVLPVDGGFSAIGACAAIASTFVATGS